MQLFWHRRDLRVADNRGLAEASDSGETIPVFVFDPEVLEQASPPRVTFLLEALAELRTAYRDRGSDLVVLRGDPADVLVGFAADSGVGRVVWNRDYTGLARARDARVRRTLEDDTAVEWATFHDAIHHEPGSITTQKGEHYSVFSYFFQKWRDREKEPPFAEPDATRLASVSGDPLPVLSDLGFDDPEATVQDAGAEAARDRLRSFCSGPIYRYGEDREYPSREGVSRLSTDLKWGTIGIRELYAATEEAAEEAGEEGIESIEEFRSQLAWREFYAHVTRFNPHVVVENYDGYEHGIEWREDPEGLQAWKDGETGFPIVDAGMRQLRAEAYVHNRVRMIVASFLTKDLLVDWREGYDWFREKLADHDTANDAGGWQWAASTGTDAQPYFRIFNPIVQGRRYDPDAEYVKEYVPELRDVDPSVIHSWDERSPAQRRRSAPDYPAPIVDHDERRERAIETFRRARGED